jgi:hypothetical protein
LAFKFDLNSNRFTNDKRFGNGKDFLISLMAFGEKKILPGMAQQPAFSSSFTSGPAGPFSFPRAA